MTEGTKTDGNARNAEPCFCDPIPTASFNTIFYNTVNVTIMKVEIRTAVFFYYSDFVSVMKLCPLLWNGGQL